METELFSIFFAATPAAGSLSGTEPLLVLQHGATAQTAINDVLALFSGNAGALNSGALFDQNLSGNPNLSQAWWLQVVTDGFDVTPGFPDSIGLDIDYNVLHGLDVTNAVTGNRKITFGSLFLNCSYSGAGQRNTFIKQINDFSNGDCFAESTIMIYNGTNTGSDEGKGFHSIGHLFQNTQVTFANIVSVGPRSSVNATTSTVINDPGNTPLTINITGTPPLAGDWVVIDQDNLAPGLSNMEPVKVISATATSFTGVFRNNHNSGVVVLPATRITVDDATAFGDGRLLVNQTKATYSTGTITDTNDPDGGDMTGSGTSWTANMVGGNAHNVGCLEFDVDTITTGPFSPGFPNQLTSYYPITSITDGTHLNISVLYNFGSESYSGLANSNLPATYKIYQSMFILWAGPGQTSGPLSGETEIICSYSAATWSPGDSLECAYGPNPTITPWSFQVADYTPASVCNPFFSIANIGINQFRGGFYVDGSQTVQGNSNNGFSMGFMCVNSDVGFVCTNNPADPQYQSPHGFDTAKLLYLSQADGNNLNVFLSAGGSSKGVNILGQTYEGTLASPQAMNLFDNLITLNGYGYDGSAFVDPLFGGASLVAFCVPNGSTWSNTDHGSAWSFNGVARGTTGQITQFTINDFSGFTLGNGVNYSQLPAASATLGAVVMILDSNVTSGNVTSGGGGHVVIAVSNGTNWVVWNDLT